MDIILSGFSGRMGTALREEAKNGYKGAKIRAGVDTAEVEGDIPCYSSFLRINESADCVIDFSNHLAITAVTEYAVKTSLPLVVATTGHTASERRIIENTAQKIPVFFAANMSMGVALLVTLAKITAKTFPDADIEIIETHHNRKTDAPSGTALMIANAVKNVRKNVRFVCGRNGYSKREKDEIGIHSVRRSNIVGIHEVVVSTDYETITLKHEVYSRTVFAQGAITAADFIIGKKAGLYDMNSLISF